MLDSAVKSAAKAKSPYLLLLGCPADAHGLNKDACRSAARGAIVTIAVSLCSTAPTGIRTPKQVTVISNDSVIIALARCDDGHLWGEVEERKHSMARFKTCPFSGVIS